MKGVRAGSPTETFVAAKFYLENWRWHNVPISIRAGKNMATTSLEVVIELRKPPVMLFADADGQPDPNLIRLRLGPNPGITLNLYAGEPGHANQVREIGVGCDFERAAQGQRKPYEHIFLGAIQRRPPPVRPDGHRRGELAHRRAHHRPHRRAAAVRAGLVGSGRSRKDCPVWAVAPARRSVRHRCSRSWQAGNAAVTFGPLDR